MTREMIKQIERDYWAEKADPIDMAEIFDLAIKALEQEPTTKNDLGVDCISREQALVEIRNLYPCMPRVDFNGSLRKWVDKYKPYIECDDAIKQLPLVTPQNQVHTLCEDCHTKMDEVRRAYDNAMKQEPFINKPCVSSEVCEHDKQEVLDKIRAEIEKWHKEGTNWSDIRLMNIEDILDKYKAEIEPQESDGKK